MIVMTDTAGATVCVQCTADACAFHLFVSACNKVPGWYASLRFPHPGPIVSPPVRRRSAEHAVLMLVTCCPDVRVTRSDRGVPSLDVLSTPN
eukprot:727951-Rhodomonas_salina.1